MITKSERNLHTVQACLILKSLKSQASVATSAKKLRPQILNKHAVERRSKLTQSFLKRKSTNWIFCKHAAVLTDDESLARVSELRNFSLLLAVGNSEHVLFSVFVQPSPCAVWKFCEAEFRLFFFYHKTSCDDLNLISLR